MTDDLATKRRINFKALSVVVVPLLLITGAWIVVRAGLVKATSPQSGTVQSESNESQTKSSELPFESDWDKEHRLALESFLSKPDPPHPVRLDEIQGTWWTENSATMNKEYAFVEEENVSGTPLLERLSFTNGTQIVIACQFKHTAQSSDIGDAIENACDMPPLFTWVRVAITDVIKTSDAEFWGVTYRPDHMSAVSSFLVKVVCFSNGSCTTADEAGKRGLETYRNQRKYGEREIPAQSDPKQQIDPSTRVSKLTTKREVVVGQVFGIQTQNAKPCVPNQQCWWQVIVEEGGNSEYLLLTPEKPAVQEGQFIRAQAEVSASGEKSMTKAEIEAHLPKLLSYKIVLPGDDVEASRVAYRMKADADALATMHPRK